MQNIKVVINMYINKKVAVTAKLFIFVSRRLKITMPNDMVRVSGIKNKKYPTIENLELVFFIDYRLVSQSVNGHNLKSVA